MKTFLALLIKEEKAFFTSTIAYAVITVFLVIMGYSFTLTLFLSHTTSLLHLFFQMFALLLLTIPVITMRAVAEERRLRTLELVLTAPVTEVQIILAKYLACMSLVIVMLILSLAYPATLAVFGEPDWGPIYSGYLGLFLLGSALTALGLLTSSLAGSQLVAALLSLSLFLVLWIVDEFGRLLPDPFDAFVVNMSLSVHYKPFATGSLFLSDAGYFVTLSLLGLMLGVRALARR